MFLQAKIGKRADQAIYIATFAADPYSSAESWLGFISSSKFNPLIMDDLYRGKNGIGLTRGARC